MRRFDAIALDCPLFGSHLLEASAGTGKTFAIEHVVVRLLLEGIELEQILAVTFTRAATRELKMRIRTNLDRALAFLEGKSSRGWEYLHAFVGAAEPLSRLRMARGSFDRCQIFTIHGFCYRMLREFAFEAHLGFSLADPEEGGEISKKILRSVRKFLEEGREICPEQMALLLRKYDSAEELGRAVLEGGRGRVAARFSEMHRRFAQEMQNWTGERGNLEEEFSRIEKGYKVKKGDFKKQLQALEQAFLNPEDPKPFQALLWEKGSLFSFLAPENRKVRASTPESPFFTWACSALGPIVQEAADSRAIFETLVFLWREREELWWSPDEILWQMRQAISREEFADKVRAKYAAVIVDEFQDTDPLQWEIFRQLFLERPLRALYLVGDPKQSIYRFRNADIYTYLEARDLLGERALYSLEVNFRSSKPLLSVLNALFQRDLFHLPKRGQVLSYRPVEAGAEIAPLKDEKGAVHGVFTEGGFEEALLPYAVKEIERLLPDVDSAGAFALLVKDRYQAEAALKLFSQRGLPAFAKSHTLLGETKGFRALRELLEALIFPEDPVRWRIVETGPFARKPLPSRELLLEGLGPFFSALPWIDGIEQGIEELLAWEQREGFSLEGLRSCLDEVALKEECLEVQENAVQILTLHKSKGLEFDIVFAFGLATSHADTDEEIEAEKLRQLYVAMTRAKRRLYIPLAPGEDRSPIGLFCRGLSRSYFEALAEKESFSLEEIATPFALDPVVEVAKEVLPPKERKPAVYRPCFLHSFTALAHKIGQESLPEQATGECTMHSLPRGTETGIVIHQIFERIFSTFAWQNEETVEKIVLEELLFSPLQPWQQVIAERVQEVLSMPLFENFALKFLEPEMVQAEMEFLFAASPHFVKGFIDLVFCWEGKYYLLDWKTNWLGASKDAYHPEALQAAMRQHDYELQAALYAEGLQRHLSRFSQPALGGALYLFVRAPAVHFVQPALEQVHARIR